MPTVSENHHIYACCFGASVWAGGALSLGARRVVVPAGASGMIYRVSLRVASQLCSPSAACANRLGTLSRLLHIPCRGARFTDQCDFLLIFSPTALREAHLIFAVLLLSSKLLFSTASQRQLNQPARCSVSVRDLRDPYRSKFTSIKHRLMARGTRVEYLLLL